MRRATKPSAETLVAAAIYLVTAVLLTWPMPANITSQVYGAGGDAWGAIGSMREAIDSGVVPFFGGRVRDLAAPEGLEWPYPLYTASWSGILPRWLLMLVFGAVPGWNLWVLAGYFLTGLATFLLVRKLTGSAVAATVAGWAYAFFPFAAIRGGAHIDYMHGWPLVLLVWRALEVRRAPTPRNGIWAGLALVLAMSFTPYMVLFAAVVVAVLAAGDLLLAWRERDLAAHVKAWASGLWMAPVVLGLYLFINTTYGSGEVRSNSIQELYVYSARLRDYLVPVPGTGLLDGGVWQDEYQRGFALGERGLYLGWTTLALAAVAVVALLRRQLERALARVTGLLLATGLVGALVSTPPTFQPGGLTIYMPSYFIFQVASAWRVYSRFATVVMLALAILAGIGLAHLIRKRSRPAGWAIASVAAALLVYDLWWHPLPATVVVPDAPVYRTLAAQRDRGIVAEYPLADNVIPDYRSQMTVEVHDHPSLNGYGDNSIQERRALWLSRLDDPRTAGRLARLGVRWVVVNETDPYPGSPPSGEPGAGFELVERTAGRSLWRVTARPAPGMAYPATGFDGPEGATHDRWEWLAAPEGEVVVEATGCEQPCPGELRFRSDSLGEPRRLRVSGPGTPPVTLTIPPDRVQEFRVPVRVGRTPTTLTFSVTPGPKTPREVNGSADDRPLAIRVIEPEFVPRRARR